MKEHTGIICEVCLRNSHQEVRMVKRIIISTDEKGYWQKEMLCCPACGCCRSL